MTTQPYNPGGYISAGGGPFRLATPPPTYPTAWQLRYAARIARGGGS